MGDRGRPVYQIVVTPTSAILATRAVVAQSLIARLVGLISRARLEPGEALILPSCRSIHTCFMRFPIDVVFVDRNFRVVAVRNTIPPWRLTPIIREAWGVVECAAGTLAGVAVNVGDYLALQPVRA